MEWRAIIREGCDSMASDGGGSATTGHAWSDTVAAGRAPAVLAARGRVRTGNVGCAGYRVARNRR